MVMSANGLDIPYIGYIELDVVVLGQCIPGREILIVKDPENFILQGLPGMNVLGECYWILFKKQGSKLFHSPPVQSVVSVTQHALQYCEKT